MLANGSMPMLSTTTAPADSRLASSGDMLALPDDRRNPAASSSPASGSTLDTAKSNDPQPDQGRASPPPVSSAAASSCDGAGSSPRPVRRLSEERSIPAGGDSKTAGGNSPKAVFYQNARSDAVGARMSSGVVAASAAARGPPPSPADAAHASERRERRTSVAVGGAAGAAAASAATAANRPGAAPTAFAAATMLAAKDSGIVTSVPKAMVMARAEMRDHLAPPPAGLAATAVATAPKTPPFAAKATLSVDAEGLSGSYGEQGKYNSCAASSKRPAAASSGAESAISFSSAKRSREMMPAEAAYEDVEHGPVGMDVDKESSPTLLSGAAAAAAASARRVGPPSWHEASEMVQVAAGKSHAEKIMANDVPSSSSWSRGGSRKRRERDEDDSDDAGAGAAASGGAAATAVERAAAAAAHDEMERAEVDLAAAVVAAAAADMSHSLSPTTVLEDPPMGEGWDEYGNDLSKIANDAIRKAQCDAWTAKLRQEAAAIRAGDHPEVVRRSVLTVEAAKRRSIICERNAKRQQHTAERLYKMEVQAIEASYEAAIEQTRERLMGEVNEEIRRSKSRMEGFKEAENRMSTRHTRGNAKGSIEDPWLAQTTGSKSSGNGKRPLCPISLVLEEDALTEDIEFLRYSGHGGNGNGNGGGSGGGGGYGAYDMSPGVSGRARRPPAWRREE